MPYTPPAPRSPAPSVPASPGTSRRSSAQDGSGRPSLPRSASYLTRQPRRTNSGSDKAAEKTFSNNTILNGGHPPSTPPCIARQTTPPGTSEDLKSLAANSGLRQSPPPITDSRQIPNGAIMSPPDSLNSSSDEAEEPARGRTLEKQIKQLQVAISHIPQRRSMSPPRKTSQDATVKPPSSNPSSSGLMHQSFSTGSLIGLGGGRRKILHKKSSTEPNIVFSKSLDTSLTASEDDSDVEMRINTKMVRKKSGELVRPALRPSSRKRPSSMPGTPTFSKNVHFDSCLEQVRHFCDVDRPSAVSVGSSPVDMYDMDDEFPFQMVKRSRSPAFEWELALGNFPAQVDSAKTLPVRMERVWLSADQKSLLGSVVVANLAFQKFVTCRFTLDYWKTTSEVVAEYSNEVRPREGAVAFDRFTFNIKLADTAKLETKTLYFCIRYNVGGQEFWDNNNHANFHVDFKKKIIPQNGKHALQGSSSRPTNSLPRSSRRATPSSSVKASTSGALDDFEAEDRADRKSLQEVLGEVLGDSGTGSGLRLKGVKSTPSLGSDNLSKGLGSPSGQAFSNRYDFGASLSAAKQAAKGSGSPTSPTTIVTKSDLDDGLYMKPSRRRETAKAPKVQMKVIPTNPMKAPVAPISANWAVPPPYAASAIASSSYEEILHKYCFFGSSKQESSETNDGPAASPDSDIPNTDSEKPEAEGNNRVSADGSRSPSSTGSSSSSSPERHHAPSAQHHSLYPVGSGEYFYSGPLAFSSSPLHTPTGRAGSRPDSPASLGSGFAPLAATTIRG